MIFLLVVLFNAWFYLDTNAAEIVARGNCPPGTDFEKSGYIIRSARVESPFKYLSWIRTAINDVAKLSGQTFRYAEVQQKAAELNSLPDTIEQRVKVSLVITTVENCLDRELDLVYYAYTTQIAPVLSGTFESQKTEKVAPESSAGTEVEQNRWRFSPSASYDHAEKFAAGARVEYRSGRAANGYFPFDSVAIDGRGSATMHEVTAALSGAKDAAADWLGHIEWQLNYLNSSNPADQSPLKQNRGAAQLAATSRPLGNWQLPLRFGAQFEGGTLSSDFHANELSRDTVDSSGYGALKLYFGTTTRFQRNAFTASYGLEVGSTGSQGGWIKHIGDIAHDLSLPIGDHRSLDIESRLTGGIIQIPGSIPAAARFFGGNREEPFIAGNSWNIRSNPVIRSIPADRLSHTDKGQGGTRFVSYNLTAGIPIWRKPLIPPELTQDKEFPQVLAGQLKTATSLVQPTYAAKDAHFKVVTGRLGDVQTALGNLQTAINAEQARIPDRLGQEFKACNRALSTAKRRAQSASESTSAEQYGTVGALLSVDDDENLLKKVRTECVTTLNNELKSQQIAATGEALEQIHSEMEREFALIDQARASQQAEAEMSYVKRTLNTILYELNLLSVGPVLMFDVAHIGPASSKVGTRYGIGGGVRLTLVSHVDFTIGYVANPRRLAGERPGAFSFSMRFKDLLD